MLEIGNKVPEFIVIDQNNEKVNSKDWASKKVCLYFYPKDNTPGCTKESCNLRDNYDALLAHGYTVFGISPDSAKKHQNFISKFDLPFDLLVDEEHRVAEQFGVWIEKTNYGRKYMGIGRTTFIMENGVITEVISKVKTSDHAAQILGS